MAESDSRNTSGLFEIMRCARRRPSSELNMELLQGKQLPTVLGNRQILSPQTEGTSDEKPKNPKWANIMVDTCSPSSTCEPEPSPVHTTASESSSTDEYRTQSLTKELRRPCFKKPSREARLRQLNEEVHEYCALSFDEVDPFQQQGLTCRMLAFLKSLSRVLSWQDGDERGETPAYELLDLSEVDLQMFKVVAQKADELIDRNRFRQAYELLCRMRPCLSHQGEEVTREVTHSSSVEQVPSRASHETLLSPPAPQMEVASQALPVSPAPVSKAKNCNGNAGAKAKNNGGRHEKSAAGTGGGKYLCRVKVGIEEDVTFQVCRRIIGPGGENMKRIIETVGNGAVKIRLRGRGSKYLEGPEHKESNDDLMLCVSATNRRSFEKASCLVETLIGAVQQDYVAFCQARRWPAPTLTVKREAQRSR